MTDTRQFWGKLNRLGFRTYRDYLRSPHWNSVKARYRASDLPQVCMCGEEKVQLHHTTYERLGEELLKDLVPLCARCHAMVHVLERRGEIGLGFEGFYSPVRAAEYAEQQPVKVPAVDLCREMGASIARVGEWAETIGVDVRREIKGFMRMLRTLEARVSNSSVR
jgi:hypothetical protein